MKDFAIRFDFRGHRRNAVVHRHSSHFNVWFSDTELVHWFGGMIVFNDDYTVKEARKTEQKDVHDFHSAIVNEIKKVVSVQ